MKIKGMSGEEYSVTGQGQGNYNTVGASAGIASFLGFNAGSLFGGCGNGRNAGYAGPVEVITSEDRPVSRYEAGMMDKLAAKDSEIALLKVQHLHRPEACGCLRPPVDYHQQKQGRANCNQHEPGSLQRYQYRYA